MNGHARIYDYLDKQAVQGLVGEHLSGDRNRRLLIWSLLNLEEVLGQDGIAPAARGAAAEVSAN